MYCEFTPDQANKQIDTNIFGVGLNLHQHIWCRFKPAPHVYTAAGWCRFKPTPTNPVAAIQLQDAAVGLDGAELHQPLQLAGVGLNLHQPIQWLLLVMFT